MTSKEELRELINELVYLKVMEAEAEDLCNTHEWCHAAKERVKRDLHKIESRIEGLLKEC